MLDLSLLRSRSFVGILIASLLVNFAAFAAFTYTSIWLQSVVGLSPLQAGLTGLPVSIFSVALSAFTGARLHGRSPRAIIGSGMLLIAVGALACGLLVHADSSWPSLLLGYSIIGAGVGLVMPTLASSAMGSVPPQRGGMAAGTITTARQLGYAIGIAVLGTVFASRASHYLSEHGVPDPSGTAHGLAAGQAARIVAAVPGGVRSTVDAALHGASASGLDVGFFVAAGVGLVGGVAVLALVRPVSRPAQDETPHPETVPAA
jgi:MFS family permease